MTTTNFGALFALSVPQLTRLVRSCAQDRFDPKDFTVFTHYRMERDETDIQIKYLNPHTLDGFTLKLPSEVIWFPSYLFTAYIAHKAPRYFKDPSAPREVRDEREDRDETVAFMMEGQVQKWAKELRARLEKSKALRYTAINVDIYELPQLLALLEYKAGQK